MKDQEIVKNKMSEILLLLKKRLSAVVTSDYSAVFASIIIHMMKAMLSGNIRFE
jgi:hypothetical protein